ncbi:uncharacterized protein LOC122061964 isoform X2 [Macadamia integrifolia]|uniref:uncharacterized protein LOC122061964 isoform X2 n=1 Tax=Macadamia integrifolia TaxID=60698 RepID=UPI001C52AFED|nr:uncharacterized protein LOC122061964 isoform X2 [Macadamia integrifolia]
MGCRKKSRADDGIIVRISLYLSFCNQKMSQSLHLLPYNFLSALSPPSYPSLTTISSSPSSSCSYRVTFVSRDRSQLRTRPGPLHAQLSEPTTATTETPPEDGPIELPSSSSSSIFATTDDPSPIQVATSVLLTGSISVFLFRALRRRAKRAKELRVRSSGVTKRTLKDEALDSLKAMKPTSGEEGSTPSPAQALLGGITAGVIALLLYKFTITIEAALGRQTISDNFSGWGRGGWKRHQSFEVLKMADDHSGSSNNDNNKDHSEWVVLSGYIYFRHQFYWFTPLLWAAGNQLLHGRHK